MKITTVKVYVTKGSTQHLPKSVKVAGQTFALQNSGSEAETEFMVQADYHTAAEGVGCAALRNVQEAILTAALKSVHLDADMKNAKDTNFIWQPLHLLRLGAGYAMQYEGLLKWEIVFNDFTVGRYKIRYGTHRSLYALWVQNYYRCSAEVADWIVEYGEPNDYAALAAVLN